MTPLLYIMSCFPFLLFHLLIPNRSEEHTSELQSRPHLVCRLLLEKKKKIYVIGVFRTVLECYFGFITCGYLIRIIKRSIELYLKSTSLNSSNVHISYDIYCFKNI